MKKLVIILCVFLSTNPIFSQKSDKNEGKLSNAEEFAQQSGTLIEKEYVNLGDVKNSIFEAVKFTDVLSGDSEKALRYEYAVVVGTSTRTRSTYLDSDEADALLKSLNIIRDSVINRRPRNTTEVTFSSRSGFQSGTIWQNGSWKYFMQGKYYDSDSFMSFSRQKHLDDFIAILKKYKETF